MDLAQHANLEPLIRALPKSDLHVHLDGSLRLETLIDLAREQGVELPSFSAAGLRELVFKPRYASLADYLQGFRYTVAVLQSAEALERVAYELAVDCWNEGVCYFEVRFAPQLHVHSRLRVPDVVRAVARGLKRAEDEVDAQPAVKERARPPLRAAIIFCALRFFEPAYSKSYRGYFDACAYSPPEEVFARASVDLARAAVHLRNEEGLPVTGFDLAGQEKGYPAEAHRMAYQVAHEGFLGKTVHAGEDYGPESIFQAIGDLHADRLGHGTWLLEPSRVTDPRIENPQKYVDLLAQYVADHRITVEVCLTSNQQTVPELAGDLARHPFGEMMRKRISTALCTDNRLVSDTNMTREVMLAVKAFDLSLKALRDILIYAFKRSFYPGPYLEKRRYVRSVLDATNRVVAEWTAGPGER
ncbi:MAG: adenosine deaminase family protein [Planctomycetes bacterium]|nr:adenosine deaminase family protein [Planctomycetota bacterium]